MLKFFQIFYYPVQLSQTTNNCEELCSVYNFTSTPPKAQYWGPSDFPLSIPDLYPRFIFPFSVAWWSCYTFFFCNFSLFVCIFPVSLLITVSRIPPMPDTSFNFTTSPSNAFTSCSFSCNTTLSAAIRFLRSSKTSPSQVFTVQNQFNACSSIFSTSSCSTFVCPFVALIFCSLYFLPEKFSSLPWLYIFSMLLRNFSG